jgi:hypothetical protein
MEASGQPRWFERLLAQLQFELWIDEAEQIPSNKWLPMPP